MKKCVNSYTVGILTSFTLCLLVEAFSRHSFLAAFGFLWHRPFFFFYNMVLILFTLSFILWFKRKIALLILLSVIWIALGVINGLILATRVTPFNFLDILVLFDVITIVPRYFSIWQILLLVLVIMAALILLGYALKKAPMSEKPIRYLPTGLLSLATVVLFFTGTKVAIDQNLLPMEFGNLAMAYENYGFPFCFATSMFVRGMQEPDDYSELAVSGVGEPLQDLDDPQWEGEHRQPNIIMIQLESFFDPFYLKDLTFSDDPIPNFRRLREDYSSGFLTVPVVGAGTVNTEFEVLTGMAVKFFGPGEIPYKTLLGDTVVESLPHNLRELGYASHAFHNNTGTFYRRNTVFSSLGFDTFTSSEFMNIQELTLTGWPTDRHLLPPMLTALQSTEGPDFLFAITVESHGSYPATYDLEPAITATGWEDANRMTAFNYYLHAIHQVDLFIGELLAELENFPEDTVLILYGDHLPTFYIENDELANGNMYQTEFVMWDNFGLTPKHRDLSAYQLGSFVLSRLGIHHGTMANFHRLYYNREDYQELFQLLQYDMLYGHRYLYEEEFPFSASQLQMGIAPILIDGVTIARGGIVISGENFTQASRVTINGNHYETQFISPQELKIGKHAFSSDAVFTVQQVNQSGKVLSETEGFSP